jgi:aminoglycoside 6'-N-acetyltransferase
MFLASIGTGPPFGLIQRYPIAAYPEYVDELAPVCDLPPGALSVDYLIGDPSMRGRGFGAAMIAAIVADCWAQYPQANDVIVPVAAGNSASWRSLAATGFRRIAEGHLKPDNPIDPLDHYIYRISRPSTD